MIGCTALVSFKALSQNLPRVTEKSISQNIRNITDIHDFMIFSALCFKQSLPQNESLVLLQSSLHATLCTSEIRSHHYKLQDEVNVFHVTDTGTGREIGLYYGL
jgi:hypothetical protein